MNTLSIELKDCYGIRLLNKDFDFTQAPGSNRPTRSYAIYAPNGAMKSSFTKTFEQLAQGKTPTEERFKRTSTWRIEADGAPLPAEQIYVLKADIDLTGEMSAVTNLLVKPEQKTRYDELVIDLEQKRKKALNALNTVSKLEKKKVEEQLPKDFDTTDLLVAIRKGLEAKNALEVSNFAYATIFDEKAIEIIQSADFREKANDFNNRYDELFQAANTIYTKGLFNPARAETAFSTLRKESFFETGHRVYLKGDTAPIDEKELYKRIEAIHAKIDADKTLKSLRAKLSKTVQTRELTDLIETLDNHRFDFLVQQTRPENIKNFRKSLWINYLHNSPDAVAYRDAYDEIATQLTEIEKEAATVVPVWENAVARFNRRFLNMPFRLKIANPTEAALGKAAAILLFVFTTDGQAAKECQKSEGVKTLSQGERRAVHLLSFIFEVEARKLSGQKTLFICDDPADSFDYKNKHAIVQYLEDLTKVDHFYQIILTHNFDLFRTLTRFVHRKRCLSAIRSENGSVALKKFDGINNIFIKKWKSQVAESNAILIATIPFTRNLIEYTKGEASTEYNELTTLLHWKPGTATITVGNYFKIYNAFFGTSHDDSSMVILHDLMLTEAQLICTQTEHDQLKLENKILLSIASRIVAEKFITEKLRIIKGDTNYWCLENNQFGMLLDEYRSSGAPLETIELLELVAVTVSSNIHLNSFMYEPLLDLSTDHLCELFKHVTQLR